VKLVVTIDVEEDQWGVIPSRYATVHNVQRLPQLQELLRGFGIVPTYLLTHPVASNATAVAVLRDLASAGDCEIGTHCHPWNTPPFEEPVNKYNSMLCNLPELLQFRKLQRLHEVIQNNLEVTPVAFRSGRWGFDPVVASNIVRLGYRIDTSITPYTSWIESHGPDFTRFSPRPCRYSYGSQVGMESRTALIEVPATIGYLHGEFETCARLARRLAQDPFRRLKLGGLLSKLRLLRKVWLSPEMETPARMIRLVRQMAKQGYEVLNVVFHSTALVKGCGPFVRTSADEMRFLEKLRRFLAFVQEEGVPSAPLSSLTPLPLPDSPVAMVSR
jgi:peptidoglycan/xylan/chitin deacetylase (PgdA/CDA1 family)